MRVMVIGSGGREHAICAALNKSPKLTKLYCAPGNAGIAEIAECVSIGAMEFDKILGFAKENGIDIVFVAPDDPLAAGLVDLLESEGIKAFGPSSAASKLEASKAFSKGFMKRHNIPTAEYQVFSEYSEAALYLDTCSYPVVIKADGLALGKGVIIANEYAEAMEALKSIMLDKVFGKAGSEVVIEEFLEGREATVLAFSDGKTVKTMPASQDHKKAYDNDSGPNTGGMGAFAPTPYYTEELAKETLEKIIIPTINGLREENRRFKGVIYFGLMLTDKGVNVIEYNARFGDPETQAILPLLETDLLEIVLAVIEERLDSIDIKWKKKIGFCVVVASGGYPVNVVKGFEITIAPLDKDITLYHSGTARRGGSLVTNGGRVLCVTTVADSIAAARSKVYQEIDKISFTGARYRKDIGIK